MKMNKLLGLLVCTALCACSNDESGIIPNDTPNVFTGDKAYIKVRLADAGTLTRAQEGDFEYGTNEQSIKNASFYFYDADGVFVTQGDVWTDGSASTTTPAGNIEFASNNIVVLKGLDKKSYPRYMVTDRPASCMEKRSMKCKRCLRTIMRKAFTIRQQPITSRPITLP